MTMLRFIVALLFVTLTSPVVAHDYSNEPVIIDTDMGLDDAVTLALALQRPHLNVAAIVACEGVAGREGAVELLGRMLCRFNRTDIPLYAPVALEPPKDAPPFRPFAEQAIKHALPDKSRVKANVFVPDAFSIKGKQVSVWVLGPLTNLAAALKAKPELVQGIRQVMVAGSDDPDSAWNIRFDPAALQFVRKTGVPILFIVADNHAQKSPSWWDKAVSSPGVTSPAAAFINDLVSDERVRHHYLGYFVNFHDELVAMYYADHHMFRGEGGTAVPTASDDVNRLFAKLVNEGRQRKRRVVFVDQLLPENVLQPDVRERRNRIITAHGSDEWFAQLLMNELHEHLGAYSVVGVKMGIHAAELLNAPQHSMSIVSHTAPRPPVSCLNDGLIVASGSTPGRRLFSHIAGEAGATRVEFAYNDQKVTLRLKQEYQAQIKAHISKLLATNTLEDDAYWAGVRLFGLDIWEKWSRQDIFEIVETKPAQNVLLDSGAPGK